MAPCCGDYQNKYCFVSFCFVQILGREPSYGPSRWDPYSGFYLFLYLCALERYLKSPGFQSVVFLWRIQMRQVLSWVFFFFSVTLCDSITEVSTNDEFQEEQNQNIPSNEVYKKNELYLRLLRTPIQPCLLSFLLKMLHVNQFTFSVLHSANQ